MQKKKRPKKEFDKINLKQSLEKEMIREMQILEDVLNISDADDLDISDEEINASYEELVQRLKEQGIYRTGK